MVKMKLSRETDLLLGVTSVAGNGHYLLADWDNVPIEFVMMKAGQALFGARRFGNCYVMRTGRGFHLVNFSNLLSIGQYVAVLKELGCDENFARWVGKVGYGVLRLSCRTPHFNIPVLERVLLSPWKVKEDEARKQLYFGSLGMETSYKSVRRVRVFRSPRIREKN